MLMKDLACCLFIAPPSATSIVDDLVGRKLATRSADKKDRRITKISLTAKGKKALENYSRKKLEKFKKRIEKLTLREKSTLFKILEKLAQENI